VRLYPIPSNIWGQGKSQEEIDREILSAADVAEWSFSSEAARSGWVLDLTPFIEADPTFQPEDFYPNTLESFQWNDVTWGVPVAGAIPVMYYTRDSFDAAGLSYPVAGWTKEDFLSLAKQLTRYEGNEILRYGFEDKAALMTIGGQAAAVWSPGDPTSLYEEKTRAFVEWYADLHLRHGVMPIPRSFSPDPPPASGPSEHFEIKSAMWTGFGFDLTMYQPRVARLGIAPLPKGWPTPWFIVRPLIISVGTAHPQESWRWLNFVSHRRTLTPGREIYPFEVPVRRSVAESMNFWSGLAGAAQMTGDQEGQAYETQASTYRYAMEHSSRAVTGLVDQKELGEAIVAIFGGEPVDQAFARARQAAVEAYAAQEHARATPSPIVVATPATESSPQQVITFVPGHPADLATYHELALTFEQENHAISVEIRSSHSDLSQVDCFAGGVAPGNPMDRDKLLPLDPLLEQEPDFPTDVFYPAHLEAFRVEGELWGLPLQTSMWAVYYNKDLFDLAGIPYPEAGWTQADFEKKALALTLGQGEAEQYGYTLLGGVFFGSSAKLTLWILRTRASSE